MNVQDPIIKNNYLDVYSPSDDSYMILDYLKYAINEEFFDELPIQTIKNCLDLGTGTGIIAIFLEMLKRSYSKFKARVFASDIVSNALKCAKQNEKLNSINNKIKYIRSDLFESFPRELSHSFDVIIFNPPYLPSIESAAIQKKDLSWNGGNKGIETSMNFFDQVSNFITTKCIIYLISSSNSSLDLLYDSIKSKGFKIKVLDKKHIFFEDIILNKVKNYD